ncbi:MAG: Flagellar biosynthetic protein FliR [Pseudomonadota bacterium]|jgi:flagellar biosynthetic protein FliR
MNIEMLNLLDRFYALIWPMLRISAFLAFSSIFSIRAVSLRIRISIGLALTVFLAMHMDIPKIDPVTAEGLKEIFNQLFIGFAMAMLMQLATAGIVLAGQAVSGSMGLSMANMIDPSLGNVPVVSQFFTILGTLVFLSIGGHLIVFGLLLESFHLFPIGKNLMTQDLLGKMTAWGAMMFVSALLISLPVVITLLFVNIGVGFVTRAAPSLQLFSVGLPAILLSGFIVLWMAVPSIIHRINWLWVQTFTQMRGMLTGG